MNIGLTNPTLAIMDTGDPVADQVMYNALRQICRDKELTDWDFTVAQAYILASWNEARKNPALASKIFHRWEHQIKKVFEVVPKIRLIESRAHLQRMIRDTKHFDLVFETITA